MATASANSDSYDAPMFENGAWTHFFLEAAVDLDYIYGEEIASYAEAEVRAWVKPYRLRVSPNTLTGTPVCSTSSEIRSEDVSRPVLRSGPF